MDKHMGFALIELLVVVIVLSIIGIAGVVWFGTQSSQVATPSVNSPIIPASICSGIWK